VQYPFGFGLSYTSFEYQSQQSPLKKYNAKDTLSVTLKVKNIGKTDGDEVVQAYIEYPKIDRMPVKELKGFKRVSVSKGNEQSVTIHIPVTDLQKWDMKTHGWKTYPGNYRLVLGSNSQDAKLSFPFTINN
jgi:beta-glucosidase